MATQNIARFRGMCSGCSSVIPTGACFAWGAERGERLCADCAGLTPSATGTTFGRPGFTPSPFQAAFFDALDRRDRSIRLEAVAGAGKTTVIEEGANRHLARFGYLQTLYVVFNAANRDEAVKHQSEHLLDPRVTVKTFHGLGYGALLRKFDGLRLSETKMFDIWKAMIFDHQVTDREADDLAAPVAQLVGLGKNHGLDALQPATYEAWDRLIEHYDIDLSNGEQATVGDDEDAEGVLDAKRDRVIELAGRMLDRSHALTLEARVIDFNDQIYEAVRESAPFRRFDLIFVDEAQDTNEVRRAIIRMSLDKGGRVVAVGDERQAIYGFTGADADAIERIAADFNAITLPLSINYRCSRAVVEAAKEFCPHLQARPNAPAGSVEWLETWNAWQWRDSDAILCRTTAALVTLAYRMIGVGRSCRVRGRDIGRSLVALITQMQGKRKRPLTLSELRERLEAYRERRVSDLLKRGQEQQAQAIEDKIESINAVIANLPVTQQTVAGLVEAIQGLFSDAEDKEVLTLSTVHKAKGLQWPRVFVLNRDSMPSKWARREWQQVQEDNLIYVSFTRAEDALYFINDTDVTVTKQATARSA